MRGWRSAAVVTVAGLGSGMLGALLYGQVAKAPAPSPATVLAEPMQPRAPVIPPGWDLALVSRLADVERRVEDLRSPATFAAAPTEATDDGGQNDERVREQERAAHYQKELGYLEQALVDHANEASDDAWARPLATSMQGSLTSAFEGLAQAKSVDCRSKTCTATLTFPSPSDALVSLGQSQKLSVEGCRALAAIPRPPTSAGPYDLTLVYTCR